MTETEHERRVREYWLNAYKGRSPVYDVSSLDFSNNTSKLAYEPTAVLTAPKDNGSNNRRIKLKDLIDLDFSR